MSELIPLTSSDRYDNRIAFLEHFFDNAKNNSLLSQSDDTLSQLRTRVRLALNDLLVWGRPCLFKTRGLQWPYDECARITPHLEKVYHQSTEKSVRKQALLFLAFLPVPNQWCWLSKAAATLEGDPEVNAFLRTEQQTVTAKLAEKSQSTFKLSHFIQILKSPRLPLEKGVLRIFSLPYLFLDKQLLQKIAAHYVFFVEPPMGVVFRHSWWRFFAELEDPCVFGLGGEEDRRFVGVQTNTHVVSLAHGDFLSDVAPPVPVEEQDIDIVFNATFDDMPRKRHVFMLELLKDQRLQTTKALFIGRGSARNVEVFAKKVAELGLIDRVTVLSNVRRREISSYLARCKIGVHLSLYENACRCVYEYFRADIPCVLSSVTAGVDRGLFNPQTGQVAEDARLAEVIADVLCHYRSYAPRHWFLKHSGSLHSSKKLNENLASLFAENGYLWRNDIVPLGSSGATRYLEKDHYHQFLPEFQQLLTWFKTSTTSAINLTVEEI